MPPPLFSASDLQAGAKGLDTAAAAAPSAKAAAGDAAERKDNLNPLEALYQKHGGDVRAIFDELGENPRKALKYPPKSASEFAAKYLDGGYTYTDEGLAASKDAKAGGAEGK